MRNAARRVAEAYFTRVARAPGVIEDANALSWLELRETELVKVMVVNSRIGMAEMSLVHLFDDAFGERLVGTDALASAYRAREFLGGGHVFAYGVDGPRLRYFRREGWSVVQDGDTIPTPEGQVLPFGLAAGGVMYDQVRLTGAMILDARIDITRPFEILFDLRPNLEPRPMRSWRQLRRSRLTGTWKRQCRGRSNHRATQRPACQRPPSRAVPLP